MNREPVKKLLIDLGREICLKVHQSLEVSDHNTRTQVYAERDDDTIYQIDKDVENVIRPFIESRAAEIGGIKLIAEGFPAEGLTFPAGHPPGSESIILLIDPIDGTRGIMYDKRSAFFLAGAAPNMDKPAFLQDIEVAVMTELPTSRSTLSDTIWAIKGSGAAAETWDIHTGEIRSRSIQPSGARTILGGFGQISRFFPPGRQVLAAMEEELISILFPDPPEGKAIVFEDQYISSGGQLYELLMGHDRFTADIRTALYRYLEREGKGWTGHRCHPYDVVAHMIGNEAGLIITDIDNNPLNAPLDTTTPVDWIGYANKDIFNEVYPVLRKLLKKYGLTGGERSV